MLFHAVALGSCLGVPDFPRRHPGTSRRRGKKKMEMWVDVGPLYACQHSSLQFDSLERKHSGPGTFTWLRRGQRYQVVPKVRDLPRLGRATTMRRSSPRTKPRERATGGFACQKYNLQEALRAKNTICCPSQTVSQIVLSPCCPSAKVARSRHKDLTTVTLAHYVDYELILVAPDVDEVTADMHIGDCPSIRSEVPSLPWGVRCHFWYNPDPAPAPTTHPHAVLTQAWKGPPAHCRCAPLPVRSTGSPTLHGWFLAVAVARRLKRKQNDRGAFRI